ASRSQTFSRIRTRRDTARPRCLNKPRTRPASALVGPDFSLLVDRRKQVYYAVDRCSVGTESIDHLLLIYLEYIRHRHSWLNCGQPDVSAVRSDDKYARY